MTSYATLFFTKMSFCFQYLRIFPGKRMRIAIYITIAASVIYILQSVLTMVLMCQPLSSFWEDGGFIVPGKCLDFKTTLYISAAINLVTDIMIILLPIPGLKSLQLPAREKIGLIAVFSLGLGLVIQTIISHLSRQEVFKMNSQTNLVTRADCFFHLAFASSLFCAS